jgi:hypothetical protein
MVVMGAPEPLARAPAIYAPAAGMLRASPAADMLHSPGCGGAGMLWGSLLLTRLPVVPACWLAP